MGDVTQTHTISINDDDECEDDPNENFFSNITLDSGININITIDQAVITINDTAEPECGKCIIARNTNSERLLKTVQEQLKLAMSICCTTQLRARGM